MEFVMVPGGWQGGWAFGSVAGELQRLGHRVEAVTLAGLELEGPADVERPANLDAHIDQVAAIVEQRDGTSVVLCGHSYAGLVIAGVADRLGDRLEHLVFIDAYVPDDGDSCWSLTSDIFREMFIAGARADGRWVGVPEGMDPRARAHPLASFVQAVRLEGSTWPALSRTYISGGEWAGSPFLELTERLRNDPTWRVHEIPVGHNIARRDPQRLAAVLDALPSADGAVAR
ncbi:pimeloyl-ACP methyl ester carboxylesterase [Kribbella aluminosa]|uniref:Pimeloyl-ACP methyl ester carboxylesterase n=1 Tax=Kribbella aluminosa TaxID=416017 RepID=A0ABS4UZR2_9ACTN|nr:alpha/beta fold hydrolase [Kribbella aluminosa]MBP2357041.1 pimeloyl-ACP methyl ester carboxylesterase [Kribbella aluminosa]